MQACGSPEPREDSVLPDTLEDGAPVVTADTAAQVVGVENLEFSRLPTGQRILTGRLVNPTDRSLRAAQVQVSLYDEDNRSIGTMLIVVQDVAAGGEREFRETVDNDVAVGARVRAIMTQ